MLLKTFDIYYSNVNIFKKVFDFTIYCGIINNKTIFRGVVCLTNCLL